MKSTQTARIYAAYEKKLKETGAFDFDDLIYQTVQLLAEHPDVREFYQNKYRYLLVDEYQDTSVAQFRLVSLLTGPEGGLEVKEVRQAGEAGLQVCTLGKRLLRCATAPLCALSAVMYDAGEF